MNCGMPTDSAARRPLASRIVALRSLRLVEDRRGRGARDVGRHLEAHRLHRAADHLGGDGIDGDVRGQAAPVSGQLDQIDVLIGVTPFGRCLRRT